MAAATKVAKISEEDAKLFSTLLLSDIWTAAKERGKAESVKPFYLYLDEFQEFVTPIIAKNLDQARGFGLHLTLALDSRSQYHLWPKYRHRKNNRQAPRRRVERRQRNGKLTTAENAIEIDTCTESEVEGTVMIQDFERELSSVQFRSIEEQMVRAQKILFDQKQRQCMVRLADSRVPAALFTPTVTSRAASTVSGGQITSDSFTNR